MNRKCNMGTFRLMPTLKQIGVLTGGGDAPGLNAVIRAVVKSAHNSGVSVIGLEDSFDGLIYPDKSRPLTPRDVTGILRLGARCSARSTVAIRSTSRS